MLHNKAKVGISLISKASSQWERLLRALIPLLMSQASLLTKAPYKWESSGPLAVTMELLSRGGLHITATQ